MLLETNGLSVVEIERCGVGDEWFKCCGHREKTNVWVHAQHTCRQDDTRLDHKVTRLTILSGSLADQPRGSWDRRC